MEWKMGQFEQLLMMMSSVCMYDQWQLEWQMDFSMKIGWFIQWGDLNGNGWCYAVDDEWMVNG
ncbi:hypothetical protein DERP_015308 [Dermatophagoides pteronyssinus]|uniref:Uncharacterized protein n=1 Tax=Dermatophagoides pteronyssinus TaxID=6956 RepID=A0ABQ8JTM9_DERPT|nr:hypothetical protein DERP_015308 [Dermatophagoides pteronyssinus]